VAKQANSQELLKKKERHPKWGMSAAPAQRGRGGADFPTALALTLPVLSRATPIRLGGEQPEGSLAGCAGSGD